LTDEAHATRATKTSIPNVKKWQEDVKQWLDRDPNTKNIVFDKLKTDEVNLKQSNLPLEVIITYYFDRFSAREFRLLNSYWQTIIKNKVYADENITNCEEAQFIIEASKTGCNSKLVIDSLNNANVSHVTYLLLQDDVIDANSLKKLNSKSLFVLNALYSGCFDDLPLNETRQLFRTYTNIRTQYIRNPKIIDDNVSLRLNSDDDEVKASILAQNLILRRATASIEDNPLLIAKNNPHHFEEDDEYKINEIKIDELTEYKGTPQAEIKSILNAILNKEELQKEDNRASYRLSTSDKNNYTLKINTQNKLMCNEEIKFIDDNIVKVYYGSKGGADYLNNLFVGINDLNQAVVFQNFDGKVNDYFELDNSGQLKTIKSFSMKSQKVLFDLQSNDDKVTITKLILLEKPTDLNNNGESNTGTKGKASAEVNQTYKKAVSDYLKENKTEKLKTDQDVDTFMLTPQPPKYENLKTSVINQVEKHPDMYLYDAKENKIKNIKNTLFEVLYDILNDDIEKAAEKIQAQGISTVSKNISPYISVQHQNLRAPKITSKEVAQKLTDLANLLNQDDSRAKNKISSKVLKELQNNKDDLAKLIAWFNSRFAKGNQVDTEEEQNKQ